jgi:hypothetical protein
MLFRINASYCCCFVNCQLSLTSVSAIIEYIERRLLPPLVASSMSVIDDELEVGDLDNNDTNDTKDGGTGKGGTQARETKSSPRACPSCHSSEHLVYDDGNN